MLLEDVCGWLPGMCRGWLADGAVSCTRLGGTADGPTTVTACGGRSHR